MTHRLPDETQAPRAPAAIFVNRRWHALPSKPGRTLLQWLREDLGLVAAQPACDTGHCGNCAVLLNGVPTKACTVLPDAHAQGQVETLEGFAVQPGRLQPLQEALDAPSVFQCGYCKPAFVFAAKALLERNPDPDRQAVLTAFDGLLCRCTGYQAIIDAVLAAAAILRSQGHDGTACCRVHQPHTLDEAVALADRLPRTAWLAGGQQLVPDTQRHGPVAPDYIQLSGIGALRILADEAGTLSIGAACTHEEIARAEPVRRRIPELARVAGEIGDVYLRARGTLGGALAGAFEASCYTSLLLATNTRVRTAAGTQPFPAWLEEAAAGGAAARRLIVAIEIPVPQRVVHRNFRPRPARPAALSVTAARDAAGTLRIAVAGRGTVPRLMDDPEHLLETGNPSPANAARRPGIDPARPGSALAQDAYLDGLRARLLRDLALAWPAGEPAAQPGPHTS